MTRILLALLLFSGTFCYARSHHFAKHEARAFRVSKGGSAAIEKDGSLKLEYDPAQSKFTEVHFMKRENLGRFERAGVYFQLEKSEKRTANSFSLRLMDKDGEVFQFTKRINADTTRVAFEIDLKNFKHQGAWGGKEKANKKLDLPATIMGIALHYPAKAGKGDLIISTMDVDLADDFAGFTSFVSYANYMFSTRNCSVNVAGYPESLQISYTADKAGSAAATFQNRIALGTFSKGKVIVNTSELADTAFDTMTLTLRDKEGELFPLQKPHPGSGRQLVFDVDAAAPPKSAAENSRSKLNGKIDFPVDVHQIGLKFSPVRRSKQLLKVYNVDINRTPEAESCSLENIPAKKSGKDLRFAVNGKASFAYVREGQLRLLVKGKRKDFLSAELECKTGRLHPKVRCERLENAGDNSYELIFPITYAMRCSKLLLQGVTLRTAGSGAELVSITCEKPAMEFSLSVGKGSPVSTWRENSKGFAVLASRMCSKTVSGKVTFRIFNDRKEEYFKFDQEMTFQPGEVKEIPLPPPPAFGIWHIKGTMPGENGKPVSFTRRFGRMQEILPQEHKGMQYGNIMLTPHLPRCDRGILGISLIGADLNRSSFIWMDIERRQGSWNWNYVDRYMDMSRKHNVRMAPILWCPPRWATAKDWKPTYLPVRDHFGFPMPDLDLWETYVRNCVKRYGKEVRVMEVWNEAELAGFANFNPEEYAELLKRAYKVIKEERPEIKVTTCGYTCLPGGHPGMNFPDFMPRSLAAAKGSYDIHSIHLHSFFPEYAADIKSFLKLRKEWGVTVPWAANETAMTSTFCGRKVQAEIMFEKVVFSQAYGAGAYIWHNTVDLGRDHANKEHNFGILDHDFEPKHVYVAFASTIKLLRGADFVKDLTRDDLHIYQFRKGREQFFCLWTFYAPAPENVLVFSNIKGKAYWSDIYGNRKQLSTIGGKLLLKVTGEPGTLIFSAAEKPVFEGELIGKTSDPQAFELRYPELVKKVTARFEGKDVALSREKNSFKYNIDTRSLRKRTRFVTTLETVAGKIDVVSYLLPRSEFPANSDFDRQPDFVLDRRDNVTHLAPADPDYADLYWKGPQDSSAEVWMGWKDDKVLVKVKVRDDVHYQTRISKAGGLDPGTLNMWREDSLQFLFLNTGTGGFWKIGAAMENGGKVGTHIWNLPEKLKKDLPAIQSRIEARIERDEKAEVTTYNMAFPAKDMGISIGRNFRFNVMVNDNDGRIRIGFLSITPVVDDGKDGSGYLRIKFFKEKGK